MIPCKASRHPVLKNQNSRLKEASAVIRGKKLSSKKQPGKHQSHVTYRLDSGQAHVCEQPIELPDLLSYQHLLACMYRKLQGNCCDVAIVRAERDLARAVLWRLQRINHNQGLGFINKPP